MGTPRARSSKYNNETGLVLEGAALSSVAFSGTSTFVRFSANGSGLEGVEEGWVDSDGPWVVLKGLEDFVGTDELRKDGLLVGKDNGTNEGSINCNNDGPYEGPSVKDGDETDEGVSVGEDGDTDASAACSEGLTDWYFVDEIDGEDDGAFIGDIDGAGEGSFVGDGVRIDEGETDNTAETVYEGNDDEIINDDGILEVAGDIEGNAVLYAMKENKFDVPISSKYHLQKSASITTPPGLAPKSDFTL